MKCCKECFADELARQLVCGEPSAGVGACEVCKSEGVELFEVAPEGELAYQFEKMLDVFTPPENAATGVTIGSTSSLYAMFTSVWNVFSNVTEERFYRFIRELFPDDARVKEMIAGEVALAPERGTRSVEDYAVFGASTWDDFSDDIKHHHRYCAEVKNRKVLFDLLRALERDVDCDTKWNRARVWNKEKRAPEPDDLCEPSHEKSGEGRMSPKGVSCLYVASTPATAMAEIRAAVHDTVAVATMRPIQKLKILDLSKVDRISPCLADVDCSALAANVENLRRIKDELVRPMRSTDDPVEYVPTQFIADCAKHLGFDGIGYDSVMQSGEDEPGYNIACFHSAKTHFDIQVIKLHTITGIDYSTSLVV